MAIWSAVYRTSDGLLHSWGQEDVVSVKPQFSIKKWDQEDDPHAGKVWNQSTLDFDPAPNSPIIAPEAFIERFNAGEWLAIHLDVQGKTIQLLARLMVIEEVDLTGAFANDFCEHMDTRGHITPARKTTILTP